MEALSNGFFRRIGGLKKFEQKTRKKGPKFDKNSKFRKIKFKIRKYEQLRIKKWLKSV